MCIFVYVYVCALCNSMNMAREKIDMFFFGINLYVCRLVLFGEFRFKCIAVPVENSEHLHNEFKCYDKWFVVFGLVLVIIDASCVHHYQTFCCVTRMCYYYYYYFCEDYVCAIVIIDIKWMDYICMYRYWYRYRFVYVCMVDGIWRFNWIKLKEKKFNYLWIDSEYDEEKEKKSKSNK